MRRTTRRPQWATSLHVWPRRLERLGHHYGDKECSARTSRRSTLRAPSPTGSTRGSSPTTRRTRGGRLLLGLLLQLDVHAHRHPRPCRAGRPLVVLDEVHALGYLQSAPQAGLTTRPKLTTQKLLDQCAYIFGDGAPLLTEAAAAFNERVGGGTSAAPLTSLRSTTRTIRGRWRRRCARCSAPVAAERAAAVHAAHVRWLWTLRRRRLGGQTASINAQMVDALRGWGVAS